VRPEVWFDSCNSLGGKACLAALGVMLTFTSAFMAAGMARKRARKEWPMSAIKRVLGTVRSLLYAGVSFGSSVVAGLVGSACPAP